MDELQIKAAVRRQVKAFEGFEAAAEALGTVGKTQLHRLADPNTDAHISLKLAVELDALVGRPELIRLAAIALGYRLAPLSSREAVADALAALGEVSVKVGALVPSVLEKAADQVFTTNERLALNREIGEAQGALARLLNSIGGGP